MSALLAGLSSFSWRDFRFTNDSTPLSSPLAPFLTCILYSASLRLIRRAMAGRKPPQLTAVVFLHNFILSLGSLALFSALAYVLFDRFTSDAGKDMYFMICSKEIHEDGRLQWVYYVNYLFKYYELIDTVLLVVRGKEVPFLHEYHHAATLVLTWVQQREHSTVQWVPILLNLFVHVLMYYYYAMTALRINIWWKKYLTATQITQFVIDVAACVYAYVNYSLGRYCHGTEVGAWSGIAILTSYLFLFIKFFRQSYSNKGAVAKGKRANGAAVNGGAKSAVENGESNGKEKTN